VIYQLSQAQAALLARLRPLARDASGLLQSLHADRPAASPLAHAAASLQLLEGVGTTHRKPTFGFGPLQQNGSRVEVREEVIDTAPFGRLLRFTKDVAHPGPRVLVVAPQSGHFATRLRGTVEALLPEHDVHVTDWTDAREIPLSAGPFGLDDMVAQVIAWLEVMGAGAHLLAVSQPAVAVLAATALMAEDSNPARPRSLTLIGGPVDARITPTREQSLTRVLPLAWFAYNAVGRVPTQYPGAGRRVRPGAQQMADSVLADLNRHMAAQVDQFGNLVGGDEAAAEAHRQRNAELLAVMDVPAELYLDTIHRVFQTHELARGRMSWRGREVRPEAIRDTALLVIEGDRDNSCPPGQGRAEALHRPRRSVEAVPSPARSGARNAVRGAGVEGANLPAGAGSHSGQGVTLSLAVQEPGPSPRATLS
jgi:poly(3-hydroxybutyrate) depolymerase